MTAKITNVYGQYQQVKACNRDDQRSSVGRLWTEEDLHCMKMDVFCSDIAKSLDTDACCRPIGPIYVVGPWTHEYRKKKRRRFLITEKL